MGSRVEIKFVKGYSSIEVGARVESYPEHALLIKGTFSPDGDGTEAVRFSLIRAKLVSL